MSLSKNVARGGALYSRTTLLTSSKAEESCFLCLNKMLSVLYLSVVFNVFSKCFCNFKTTTVLMVPDSLFSNVILADEGQEGECFLKQPGKHQKHTYSKCTNSGENNCKRRPQHFPLSSWKSGALQSSSQVLRYRGDLNTASLI